MLAKYLDMLIMGRPDIDYQYVNSSRSPLIINGNQFILQLNPIHVLLYENADTP